MYHEEMLIDGVLYWRRTPDGEWVQYSQSELTSMCLDKMNKWFKVVPDKMDTYPPIDIPVLSIIQNSNTFVTHYITIKHVNEDDCTWRTIDDGSELSYCWDVLWWQNITPPKSEQEEPPNSPAAPEQQTKVDIFELGELFCNNFEDESLRTLTVLAFCKWLKDNNHL
jgi:hypothetical protein